MKPEKRNQIAKTTIIRKEYKIATNYKMRIWYWDDGVGYRLGPNKNYKRKQRLRGSQVRKFRTWKCKRKCQWKDR